MPYNKLLTIVTVMLMAGTKTGAQQGATVNDLQTIDRLISQKECGLLYAFVVNNPRTIAGSDPLAQELQVFIRDVERGALDCFAAPQARKTVSVARTTTRQY